MGIRGAGILAVLVACGSRSAPVVSKPPVRPPVATIAATNLEPPGWYWAHPWLSQGTLARLWGTSDVLFAVGDHGVILRSTDVGVTWTPASSGTSENLDAIAGDATSVYAGGANGALVGSTDHGVTWKPIESPTKETIEALFVDDGVVLAAYGDSIARREGTTWTTASSDARCKHTPSQYVRSVASIRDVDGSLWAGDEGCLRVSTDRGRSWQVALADESQTFGPVWRDGDLIVLATPYHTGSNPTSSLRTSKDGKRWDTGLQRESIADAWSDDSGTLLVGKNGFERSLDHGKNFERVGKPNIASWLRTVWGGRGVLVATGDDGILRRSTDGGDSWTFANAVTDQPLNHVTLDDDGRALFTGTFGHPFELHADDHVRTFAVTDKPRGTGPTCKDPQGRWYSVDDETLVTSDDGGANWVRGASLGHPIVGLYCAASGTIYAAGEVHYVGRSSDRGKTWIASGDSLGYLTGIAGVGNLVVVSGVEGAHRSTDGATWQAFGDNEAFDGVAATADTIVLLGRHGLVRTRDGVKVESESIPLEWTSAIAGNAHGELVVVGPPSVMLRYHATPIPRVAPQVIAAPKAPEGSPFAQPKLAADRARADKTAAGQKLAARIHAELAAKLPAIAAVKAELDQSIAHVARTYKEGKRDCDGVTYLYCPARTFRVPLEPRSGDVDHLSLTGLFVDGVLYAISVELWTNLTLSAEERDMVNHNVEVDGFTVSSGRDSQFAFYIAGKHQAAADALEQKAEKHDAAQQVAAEQAEHKKLCTCKHVHVGDTWPHYAGNTAHQMDEETFTIKSVTPKKCSAHVVRHQLMGGDEELDKPCTDFIEPRPCPQC